MMGQGQLLFHLFEVNVATRSSSSNIYYRPALLSPAAQSYEYRNSVPGSMTLKLATLYRKNSDRRQMVRGVVFTVF